MSKGRIRLVEVIKDDENEKDVEKRNLREVIQRRVHKRFSRKDEERAGTSGVGNGDGADKNEVDVEEGNEPTEMGIDAKISVKEAAEEKEADKANEMRQAAEKEAAEKEAAEKEAAAKEKEEAEKIAAAKKKEQAEKLAAAKKEKAEKLAAAKKEQAEKLATKRRRKKPKS
ncbi:hypothetical protein Tco_1551897 [Tanacetum coccineum]